MALTPPKHATKKKKNTSFYYSSLEPLKWAKPDDWPEWPKKMFGPSYKNKS